MGYFHKVQIFTNAERFALANFFYVYIYDPANISRSFCIPRHITTTHDLCYRVQDTRLIHGYYVYSTLKFSL